MSYSIVLSDLHVGERRCSLAREEGQQRFLEDVKQFSPIEELILLGDIFELNLAPLNKVLDGSPGYFEPETERSPHYMGLRSFLRELASLPIQNVLYLPGNHDYQLFQLLNSIYHPLRAIEENRPIDPKPVVRVAYKSSFLNGLFPEPLRQRFAVVYPEHLITSPNGDKIVLTHGHHLDKSQTLWQDIEDAFRGRLDLEEAVLEYESRISAYQGIAHFQSKNYQLRTLIETGYLLYRLGRKLMRWWQTRRHVQAGMRNKPINAELVRKIEVFLQKVSKHGDAKAFVFGHTHDPGLRWNAKQTLLVANCGSFLVDPKRSQDFVGTYVVINNDPEAKAIDDRIQVRIVRETRAETLYSTDKGIRGV